MQINGIYNIQISRENIINFKIPEKTSVWDAHAGENFEYGGLSVWV